MKAILVTFFLAAGSSLAGAAEYSGPDLNWAVTIQKQVDSQGSMITRIQKQADAQASKTTEIQKQQDSLSLSVQDARIPTGAIVSFYGDKAPKGWLLCDGKTIPEEYKDLRKLIGERLPDLRGTFTRGSDKGDSETGRFINYIIKM